MHQFDKEYSLNFQTKGIIFKLFFYANVDSVSH